MKLAFLEFILLFSGGFFCISVCNCQRYKMLRPIQIVWQKNQKGKETSQSQNDNQQSVWIY